MPKKKNKYQPPADLTGKALTAWKWLMSGDAVMPRGSNHVEIIYANFSHDVTREDLRGWLEDKKRTDAL